MSKLSLKVGTYFLILALCIETIAFVSFYKSLSKMRVEEETVALLEKGNRYRDTIERRAKWSKYGKDAEQKKRAEHFNRPASSGFSIEDAAEDLMETEALTNSDIAIVITDSNGNITSTSETVTKDMQKQLHCKIPPLKGVD